MNVGRSAFALVVVLTITLSVVIASRSTAGSVRQGVETLWRSRPHNLRRTVLSAALIVAVVFGVMCLLAPVRITGRTSGGEAQLVSLEAPAVGTPTPAPMSLTIVTRSPEPVTFLPPAQLRSAVANGLDGVDLAGWVPNDDATALTSVGVGSAIEVTGRFASLDLPFRREPGAGSIEIALNGQSATTLSLDGPVGVDGVRAESGGRLVEQRSTFLGRGLRLEQGIELQQVSATVGLIAVDVEVVRSGTGVAYEVGLAAVVLAVVGAFAGMLLVVLVALAVLVVAYLVGCAAAPAGWTLRASPAPLPRALVGTAIAMLVVGALNYVAPVGVAVFALVPLISWGAFRLTRQIMLVEPRPSPVRGRMALVPLCLGAGIVAFLVSHFVLTGRLSIGFLQTDVFDTFNLTLLFWDESALGAATDFGNGFRLLDYSARAAIWGAGLDRPSDSIVVVRVLLAVMTLVMSSRVTRRLGVGVAGQSAVAVLAVLSAPLTSLWFQGYMSREFFVTWMILGLLALVDTLNRGRRDARSWAEVGVVCWVSLVVVPPYFILAAGIALGCWMISRQGRRTLDRGPDRSGRAYLGVATSLVLAVPNLFWLRDASDAERYVPALNALTYNIVIPFIGSSEFPAAMFGFVPFHANSAHQLGPITRTIGPLTISSDLLGGAVPLLVGTIAVGLALAAGAVIAWRTQRTVTVVLLSIVICYLAGVVVLRLFAWTGQLYFSAMFIWTLAPVALVSAALVMSIAVGRRHGRTTVGWAVAVVLVGLVGVNALSSGAEFSLWRDGETGPRATRWHADQAGPLARFTDAVEDGSLGIQGDDYSVVATLSQLTATDDDRVLLNGVVNALEAAGKSCGDCVRNPDVYFTEVHGRAADDEFLVDVGGGPCTDRPEVWRDTYVVVCGPTEA